MTGKEAWYLIVDQLKEWVKNNGSTDDAIDAYVITYYALCKYDEIVNDEK